MTIGHNNLDRMRLVATAIVEPKRFLKQNFQNASFKNADLRSAIFTHCDLRGTDFSGANLTEAQFKNVKTGIPPFVALWIFTVALMLSLLSGYIAALAGNTIQTMLVASEDHIRAAGIISGVMTLLFIALSFYKGVGKTFAMLIVPTVLFSAVLGVISYSVGVGNGLAMLYLVTALLLVTLMFVVGTVARAVAGSTSNILFLIVAISGGIFGRTLGGGIGTIVMAIACMQISKKALKGAKGFESLRSVGFYFARKFGTSFRGARMIAVIFSDSHLKSTDFSKADITLIRLCNSKKTNCIIKH